MTTPTVKVVFTHLLTNILELDTDDIKEVQKPSIKSCAKLSKQAYNNLDTLRKEKDVPMSVWRRLIDWKIYMDASSPLYTNIMTITADKWQYMVAVLLQVNHLLTTRSINTTPLTVTSNTVNDTQIECMSFLK